MVHFVIPEGTTSIEMGCWKKWKVDKETLEKVTIPTSVESIGSAFARCSALLEVAITTAVESTGDGCFFRCSALVKVMIPTSVKSIGRQAFMYCSALVEVTIPPSVESIGSMVFDGCSAMLKVTIPTSVK